MAVSWQRPRFGSLQEQRRDVPKHTGHTSLPRPGHDNTLIDLRGSSTEDRAENITSGAECDECEEAVRSEGTHGEGGLEHSEEKGEGEEAVLLKAEWG
eukprot:gene2490-3234_t